jgi:hypothetical protein
MRAAITYSLAGDQASLDRLRDHFTAKMSSGPDASAFTVVTQEIDSHGVAFRDLASKIASVDTFLAFKKDFCANYGACRAPTRLAAPPGREIPRSLSCRCRA